VALLLDLQVLHHDYPVHVKGYLNLLGDLNNRAVGDVVLDDLHHAALSQEGRGILNHDDLRLDAQNAEEGQLFVEFAVDSAFHALDFTLQLVLFVVFEIILDLKLSGEKVSLKFVEIFYLPTYVFLEGAVEIKVVFGDDTDRLSQLYVSYSVTLSCKLVDFFTSDLNTTLLLEIERSSSELWQVLC
jgi:hypothetical protein